MFPFLFLSQLNSSNSSSYLRGLQSNCQKGTAVETCTETQSLTSKWPLFQNLVKSPATRLQEWIFPQKSCYQLALGSRGFPQKPISFSITHLSCWHGLEQTRGVWRRWSPGKGGKTAPALTVPLTCPVVLPQAPHTALHYLNQSTGPRPQQAVLKDFGLETSSRA